MQYRIGAEALTDGWGFSACFTADPIAPLVIHRFDHTGVYSAPVTYYNLAAAPAADTSALSRSNTWRSKADAWRLAYASKTGRLDTTSIANQGTVVAGVVPFLPQVATASGIISTGAGTFSAATQGQIGYPVWCYDYADGRPNVGRLRSLPACYSGEARDGLYMPLKHSSVENGWVTARELHQCYTLGVDYGGLPAAVSTGFPYYNGFRDDGGVVLGANIPTNSATLGYTPGHPMVPSCGLSAAHSVWSNLSATAVVVFDVVLAFEVIPKPGTDWVPFCKRSPMYDSQALLAYEMVAGQVADGFPADFNDFDQMWPYINSIANTILPMVGLLGPAGKVIEAAGSAAARAVDAVVARRAKSKPFIKASGSDKAKSKSDANARKMALVKRK